MHDGIGVLEARAECVAELNSRTDLAQHWCLLQDDDVIALFGKARRSREPANAAPCYGAATSDDGAS